MILKLSVFFILSVFSNAAPVAEEYNLSVNEFLNDDDMDSSTDAELGEYFEGDMVLSSAQLRSIQNADIERNGLRNNSKRWPNRTVVYHIVEDDFGEKEVKMIEEAMADIANKSCLTFRSRKNNEHAVTIQGSENGCYSNVGLNIDEHESGEEEEETRQVLNLAKGCFKHGTVVHEMLHTLGFYHMQSTYDRDDFVEIVWENIKSGVEHNFAKYTVDTVTDFGVQYDYDSVMHYPETAFTKNGNKTIIPLKENVKIGQRKGLSERDILKLNKMYCEDDESISYMV
ncbi:zinc metalloproteinase nas-4-like [Vanessa atalanta]|uniref:zinc metalloproteinase nas-4-like n=1 Tax=Vanessa atalanta TaxID=42275 RepID=UPI001FCD68E9|nr:zinc metalloproteinase nas-4-like [Vanessa atalanta]